MSTIINDLYADHIEVHIHYDGDNRIWHVDINNDDADDDRLIDGYTGFKSQDEAEFHGRAWIAGYKAGRAQK